MSLVATVEQMFKCQWWVDVWCVLFATSLSYVHQSRISSQDVSLLLSWKVICYYSVFGDKMYFALLLQPQWAMNRLTLQDDLLNGTSQVSYTVSMLWMKRLLCLQKWLNCDEVGGKWRIGIILENMVTKGRGMKLSPHTSGVNIHRRIVVFCAVKCNHLW